MEKGSCNHDQFFSAFVHSERTEVLSQHIRTQNMSKSMYSAELLEEYFNILL